MVGKAKGDSGSTSTIRGRGKCEIIGRRAAAPTEKQEGDVHICKNSVASTKTLAVNARLCRASGSGTNQKSVGLPSAKAEMRWNGVICCGGLRPQGYQRQQAHFSIPHTRPINAVAGGRMLQLTVRARIRTRVHAAPGKRKDHDLKARLDGLTYPSGDGTVY